jgi:hypothetical protein
VWLGLGLIVYFAYSQYHSEFSAANEGRNQ